MDARYYDEEYFDIKRIFGSAAPKLDEAAGQAPSREREERRGERTRERENLRVLQKPKSRQGISAFAVIGWLAAAFIAVSLILSYVELNSISAESYSLSEELEQLKLDETKLKIDYETTFKLDEVEGYAINILGMVKAENGQVKYLSNRVEDQAVVLQNGGSGSGIIAKIKNMFSAVSEYFK